MNQPEYSTADRYCPAKRHTDPNHLCRDWLGQSVIDARVWNNLLRIGVTNRNTLLALTPGEYTKQRNMGKGTWETIAHMQMRANA